MLVASLSCSKEMEFGATAKKSFNLVGDCVGGAETRTMMDSKRNMLWLAGDIVYWYCLNSTGEVSGNNGNNVVSGGSDADVIHLNYNVADDKSIVAYYKGPKVGNATETSSTVLEFAGAVPDTQNGTLEPYHIAVGYSAMEDNTIRMHNVQSYISFTLKDNTIGGKAINKIVITSHDTGNPYLCGNMTVNPEHVATTDMTVSGGTQVTVQLADTPTTFSINTPYYVALRQGTITGGIRINFYNGSTLIGYADATNNLKIGRNRICELGELKAHSTVIGTSISVAPASVSFTKDMTKKLYIAYTPSDVTKVTWSVTNSKDESGTEVDNDKIIKRVDNLEFTDGSKLIAELIPGGTKGTCTVTATLEGGEKTASCSVEIGDFVDLGITRHWAASNLTGNYSTTPASNSLALASSPEAFGDYYMWGWVTKRVENEQVTGGVYQSRWPGLTYSDTWGGDNNIVHIFTVTGSNGYTSTQDPLKTQLDLNDDAAYLAKASNKKWRIPSTGDWTELKDNTVRITSAINGNVVNIYQSKVANYEDMYICIPFAGDLEWYGTICDRNARMGVWTRNVNTNAFQPHDVFGYCGGCGQWIQYKQYCGPWADALREDTDVFDNFGFYGRITGFSIRPVRKTDGTDWDGTEP